MDQNEEELAGVAMQFMQRVQLQGQEVPAFNAVMGWLDSICQGASEAPEKLEEE